FEYHIGARLPAASVARNPVKVPRDTPFAWPETTNPLRLACVARMQARPKGHDLLLQALADPCWKNRPVHLSFFGDGENRRGMELLAHMLGISDRVCFHEHVESVAEIWRDHHMIAQPSRNEGMPLSLVEALMYGRPALATDVAGHTEIITDGVNGFIAEAPTVRHIGAALERVWTHRDQLPQMAKTAYERIRKDIPPHPVQEFASQILAACQSANRT
ncbi:MAG: glycosyltransferase, partial [Prosthecobacter sp.]|nr:glycosyltransferase [Prosthecobacter sp.]